ncbi:MAG: hypothetical protein H3C51_08955 [Rubellimicrobium sp.]|nr:hypothetical protein [Rubellimicrobium sp.]
MKQLVLAFVAPLALAACVAGEPAAVADEDTCGAAALEHLVGQPQSVLDGMTFPDGTRILPPGAPMTMDFRPDRLNIFIGEDGLIERLQCV